MRDNLPNMLKAAAKEWREKNKVVATGATRYDAALDEAADAIEELQQLTNAQLDIIKQYQAYLDKTRWIKFVLRPLTEEEQREHPDWRYILDCHTPDDGQEILVSDGRYVWTDTFYQDGECYLDGGAELESCWWQPMPKPPKEET